jgi:hypothetical protein
VNTDTAPTDPDREDADTAAHLLDEAADLLTRHGWRQGSYWPDAWVGGHYHDGDPCCMVGALGVCSGITDPDYLDRLRSMHTQAGKSVIAVLAEQLGLPFEQLEDWNDDPHRTSGEVIDALHDAARQLRERTGTRPGGPSTTTFHPGGPGTDSPNHQNDSKETPDA